MISSEQSALPPKQNVFRITGDDVLILRSASHPCTIHLEDMVDTPNFFFNILELWRAENCSMRPEPCCISA